MFTREFLASIATLKLFYFIIYKPFNPSFWGWIRDLAHVAFNYIFTLPRIILLSFFSVDTALKELVISIRNVYAFYRFLVDIIELEL